MALIIRPLRPEADLDAYLAVRSQTSRIPFTAAMWWDEERRARPEWPARHLVGECAGRIVAVAAMRESQTTRNAVDAWLVVDRDERGRGHGRAMVEAVRRQIASTPATRVVVSVRDDDSDSRAWAERRGFVVFDHTFESRLDLERFDPTSHRWAADGAEAAGLTIEPCQDGDRLYELAMALFADVPAVSLDPVPREEFQRTVVDRTGAFSLVAAEAENLVGLAIVVPTGEDGAWHWLTGVRAAFRGRGLARALKVAAAEEARRRGRRWIGTSNNAVNAPMLAVNDALGFQREEGVLWLRRQLTSPGGGGSTG